ncbi:MAG TPA: ATP-dependent DNA helicase RecG [Candidatus Sulfotelmatobacter sp.]|nr:ATP-dependent DNA helicase RecG [Candidatus Sulfotelmatobacter sp.]
MTLDPRLPVARLRGIGERTRLNLERMGIITIRDLLFHFPRRYEDSRTVIPVSQLVPGEVQTVQVTVRDVSVRIVPRWKTRERPLELVQAILEDDAGDAISAVWFNRKFITRELSVGSELLVSGLVEMSRRGLSLRSPAYERIAGDGSEQRHVGRLVPVYPEAAGVKSRFLRETISSVLVAARAVPDVLPAAVRAQHHLLPVDEALRRVHFPETLEEAEAARERFAFQDVFLLQLAAARARRRRMSDKGVVVPYDVELARAFVGELPFRLTDGQRIAAHQVLTDMARATPMNRLLQGDVGSGKTVVAAMAAVMTRAAGFQTAVMAPTEILARQHHATFEKLLGPHGLTVRLLLGSTGARARREITEGLAGGNDQVLVGTHALLEEDIVLPLLGLVVVDEQHRFGVAQRQRLRLKSGAMPNFLAMTATPIPRSLHLSLYGDVDVSELHELPPGRVPVETRVVAPHERERAYDFVRSQAQLGRQAFVICPLIEESDKLAARSAIAEHARLSKDIFPDLRVELLHGRMSTRDKEAAMERFAAGAADILVATSVVEVGVDIPNATVMIVEGAERFGLAQLHQLRGRVGRGELPSYCLLFEGGVDADGSERLRQVAATPDGFEIAELDMRTRGPGDVIGMRQHGLPEIDAGDLLDVGRLRRAQAAADMWLDEDPDLTNHPPLTEAMLGYGMVFDLD